MRILFLKQIKTMLFFTLIFFLMNISGAEKLNTVIFIKRYRDKRRLWNHCAYSIEQINDGFVISGWLGFPTEQTTGHILLIKTDFLGNIKWAKTYSEKGRIFKDERVFYVQKTNDEGFIVAGYTYPSEFGRYDVLLIKMDTIGNIKWSKIYGGENLDIAHLVQNTKDKGYILVGCTESFGAGNKDILLIKIDGNGNIEWAKTYGGKKDEEGYFIQQTSDNGYIIVGYTTSFGAGASDILLIRIDFNGNIKWAKTYGGKNYDYAFSVQHTPDEGFIVVGYTESFGAGSKDIFLIKTDADGNIKWTKTFGGKGNDYAYSVHQTKDDGFIIAGYTNSFGNISGDIILIKTKKSGDVEWSKIYRIKNSDEYVYSIHQTSDGGYIAIGKINNDILIIKTENDGNIGSCKIVRNAKVCVNKYNLSPNTPNLLIISPAIESKSISILTLFYEIFTTNICKYKF